MAEALVGHIIGQPADMLLCLFSTIGHWQWYWRGYQWYQQTVDTGVVVLALIPMVPPDCGKHEGSGQQALPVGHIIGQPAHRPP